MKLTAFCNIVRKVLDPIFTRVAVSAGYRVGRNIPLALQRGATLSTAEYVLEKMNTAAVFKSAHELLAWAAEKCREADGLALEFGVWKGNSLRVLVKTFRHRIYGFDSFRGLPEDWRSGIPAGTFALKQPPKVPPNAELVVGWFNETLDGFLASHPGRIKFLHIDCDLYSSTRQVLAGCRERLRPGSIIVFDEYFNYPGWREGEFRAFQEMTAQYGLTYRYLAYVGRGEQVAIEITSNTLPSAASDA